METETEKIQLEPIPQSEQVYYIKLGKHGCWEKKCLEEGNIQIGWIEWNHEDCLQRKWAEVQTFSLTKSKKATATKTTHALKHFYELDSKTLWITFYAGKMWWCFADTNVEKLVDGSKIRKVIGKWRDTDIKGNILSLDSLTGKLTQVTGFLGTICYVKEWKYVIDKINANPSSLVSEASNAKESLAKTLLPLLQRLTWKDFELLVDLLFTHAGWQRVSPLGKTEKTADAILLSPVTDERAMLQIKSRSTSGELEQYVTQFKEMTHCTKMFYAVHSPDNSLSNVIPLPEVNLITGERLCKLIIDAGLSSWLIGKCY